MSEAMRELGSEFWSVPLSKRENGLFPAETAWFQSGRSALRALLQSIKAQRPVRTAALPAWCCDSMIEPFVKEGIEVCFYPVFPTDGGVRQDVCGDCDITYLMDCFGYERPAATGDGIVIRDITHSLFSAGRMPADHYFGSVRKWCGVWTGGFAWSADKTPLPQPTDCDADYVSLRRNAMEAKERYICGESDSKEYLSVFAQAEDKLEACTMNAASERDIRAAAFLDAELIRSRRRENARVLLETLSERALFPELGEEDCPLFVPILTKNRDGLRRYLIERDIYCPVHWPRSALHRVDEKTARLYEEELSLVCDQRYDRADMERMAALIGSWLRENPC